jgi:hypothetical protein
VRARQPRIICARQLEIRPEFDSRRACVRAGEIDLEGSDSGSSIEARHDLVLLVDREADHVDQHARSLEVTASHGSSTLRTESKPGFAKPRS